MPKTRVIRTIVPKQKKQKQGTVTTTTSKIQPIRVVSMKSPSSHKTFNLKHTELISSVRQTQAGEIVTINADLNPGNGTTFPWLSQIANNFEYYRFRTLAFRYVPRCSMTTSGSLIMAIDYDTTDAAPMHMQDIANMLGSRPIAVWENALMPADPRSLHLYPYRYLRSSGSDPRLESVGRFYMMSNADLNVTFGDVWVEYDIDLMAPQFAEPTGAAMLSKDSSAVVPTKAPLYPDNSAVPIYQKLSEVEKGANAFGLNPSQPGKYLLNYMAPRMATDELAELTLTDVGNILEGVTKVADSLDINYDLGVDFYSGSWLLDVDKGKFAQSADLAQKLLMQWDRSRSYVSGSPGLVSFLKVGDSFLSDNVLGENITPRNGIWTLHSKPKEKESKSLSDFESLSNTIGSQPIPTQSCDCGTIYRSVKSAEANTKRISGH